MSWVADPTDIGNELYNWQVITVKHISFIWQRSGTHVRSGKVKLNLYFNRQWLLVA